MHWEKGPRQKNIVRIVVCGSIYLVFSVLSSLQAPSLAPTAAESMSPSPFLPVEFFVGIKMLKKGLHEGNYY